MLVSWENHRGIIVITADFVLVLTLLLCVSHCQGCLHMVDGSLMRGWWKRRGGVASDQGITKVRKVFSLSQAPPHNFHPELEFSPYDPDTTTNNPANRHPEMLKKQ